MKGGQLLGAAVAVTALVFIFRTALARRAEILQEQEAALRALESNGPFRISRTKPFKMVLYRGEESPVIPVKENETLKWEVHTTGVRVAVYLNENLIGIQDPVDSVEYARGRRVNTTPGNFQLIVPAQERVRRTEVVLWFE